VPLPQDPHAALEVPGLPQTGVRPGQSALEPDPALPVHAGVTHSPVPTLQTCPLPHCPLAAHWMVRVPVLVNPTLLATMVAAPSGKVVEVQDQVPPAATVAVHTVVPPAVTVTL